MLRCDRFDIRKSSGVSVSGATPLTFSLEMPQQIPKLTIAEIDSRFIILIFQLSRAYASGTPPFFDRPLHLDVSGVGPTLIVDKSGSEVNPLLKVAEFRAYHKSGCLLTYFLGE